jgi:hypothetical protein
MSLGGLINLSIFVMFYLSFGYVKKNVLFYYKHNNIILYLRSFTFDYSVNSKGIIYKLYLFATQNGYHLLKIGNPKTLFSFDEADCFYLPVSDWQKALRKYILKAKFIFVVLDLTQGVIWEVLNHLDMNDKFIYYINDKSIIENIINLNQFKKEQVIDSPFAQCMKGLNSLRLRLSNSQYAFYYDNKYCYYSDNTEDILMLRENKKVRNEINIFEYNTNKINI